MTVFDDYVNEILKNNHQLVNLRLTVEKELFHQDILRIINSVEIGKKLVFMGGTCLRLCYESGRLSEDLDFSTESLISEEEANHLSDAIRNGIADKYKLSVNVSKPKKDSDTETWKISIVTHPGHTHIPTQQIHIDICHCKSYMNELRLVRNTYGITGEVPLFIKAEKLEEILIDKIIAFAFRNRIKNRDLWDIYSLYCKNIKLKTSVLKQKVEDKGHSFEQLVSAYTTRIEEIKDCFPDDFHDELSRFLAPGDFENSILSKGEGPKVFNTILSDYLKEMVN